MDNLNVSNQEVQATLQYTLRLIRTESVKQN